MAAEGGAPSMRLGALLRLLFSCDLRSLALFRVMLGVALLYVAAILAPDLTAFFSDDGVLTRTAQAEAAPFGRVSVLMLSGSPWAARLVWLALVLSALALLIGWRARWAAMVAWLAMLSLAGRNTHIVQGGDVLLPLLLFWAMFLPVSAVFSVDAALREEDMRAAPPAFSVATIGVLLQALHVYVFGALLKSDPVWHEHFSAVWLAIHLDTFATPLAHGLRHLPALTFWLTVFVFLIELLSPCLLFFPDARLRVRTATLALLGAMHVGFRLFLNIGHFWLASLASLSPFLPGAVWDAIARRYWREDQRRIAIWYDRDCGFCLKIALTLREFFLPRCVPIRPAQEHPEIGPLLEREVSWVVEDGRGGRLLHWEAVSFVMRQSPLLRPLGWLAALYGAAGLGRPTYDLIGRSRGGLGRLTATLLRPAETMYAPGRAMTALLALVVVFCFAWNVREHFAPGPGGSGQGGGETAFSLPEPVRAGAAALGLAQRWGMFAPNPALSDGYPSITADFADGRRLDLFLRPPEPPREGRAPQEAVMGGFATYRWRKYFNNIAFLPEPRRSAAWREHAGWLCREANDRAEPGRRLVAVAIVFHGARTVAGGVREPFDRPMGAWRCPE